MISKKITYLVLTMALLSTCLAVSAPRSTYAATDCSDVFTPLSSYVVNGVNANKSFYVSVMNQTNVPWELLAAIHYRETNFSHTNPSNGQGIFQFVNGDGGPYPAGPVSDGEFVRQLTFMANRIQSDYAYRNSPSPASVTPRKLVANEQDITLVKNTLFSYNGRASVYANQAGTYGFNPATQPYEGSPYVMNRYDCNRSRMGIITRDYATGIDSTDTRYGAFTIFARLRGDNYWLSTLAQYSWLSVSQEIYSNPARTSGFNSGATAAPNGLLYARVKARNIGSQSWSNSSLRLGTTNLRDRSSIFTHSSWLNPSRPVAMTEATVNPGGVATFDFVLKAPEKTGSYREHFSLVNDGTAWLNDPGLYYPIDVVAPVAPRNSSNIELSTEKSLKKGEHLLSPDAQSSLVLQENGDLVYYSSLRKVWSTNTAGQSADRLVMQPDGNLVLYSTNNTPLWYSASHTTSGGATLRLQSDGNAVVYGTDSLPLWSVGYVSNPNLLSSVATTMQPVRMYPGQYMETADRKYQLTLQPDGNLVLYSQSKAIWSTMTIGSNPAAYLRMQEDGNLVLYTKTSSPLWSSKSEGNGLSTLVIQNDGNLVIYSGPKASWSSGTFGR